MSSRSTISLVMLSIFHAGIHSIAIADENSPESTTLHPPIGFVLVEEDRWYLMSDEPDRHIDRAREAFIMMDSRTAAAELRKVAIHVKIAASHATERAKRSLVHSEHELDQIARQIENGTLRSMDELDFATARALHALADYQYIKAADAWRRREARASGEYLRAATFNLERAAARTDTRLRSATAEVAKDSRLVSSKLIEGTGFVVDEVGAGIEAVGRQIEHVGMRVAPAQFNK